MLQIFYRVNTFDFCTKYFFRQNTILFGIKCLNLVELSFSENAIDMLSWKYNSFIQLIAFVEPNKMILKFSN